MLVRLRPFLLPPFDIHDADAMFTQTRTRVDSISRRMCRSAGASNAASVNVVFEAK